ncbi:hypothetical protein [Crateriforma conspicua]|uniref:Uncharacterized protein n=1 Tax=Crateriforma conspicua TaxID=2527996 RepID=A0A5C5XSH0_9PLAN|nr:hypothetical protein [Crateriforma conspicua]QDV66263.1 hypothetical protein Mal65_54390 [Crateriforma conspicua]TWT65608.1 hypothetical protein Pan14r_51550 [Crateriforma conspicua]
MSIKVYEHFYFEDGVDTAKGDGDTRRLGYTVTGTNLRSDVVAAVKLEASASYDGLEIQTIEPKQTGDQIWDVFINYGTRITQSMRYSFDTSGNSARITHGFSETRYGSVPPMDAALNVQDGRVEGFDKVIPGMKFSVTQNWNKAFVTDAYLWELENLTGTINRDPFLGRAAESLLFLGASGGQESAGDPEITYHYLAGRHIQNLQIGDITGINKKAHQFIWPDWREEVDTGTHRIRKVVKGVYVNDVAEIADWSDMFPY